MLESINKQTSRKAFFIALGLALCSLPAQATHYLWLDFTNFDLRHYPQVNGRAPTSSDVNDVKNRIVSHVVRDYAVFDVYVTDIKPNRGRYARVNFVNANKGTLLGEASACDTCTGKGSWSAGISTAEVYIGSPASRAEWQGSKSTSARIANVLGQVASHEAGHLFGLDHGDAADDYQDWKRSADYVNWCSGFTNTGPYSREDCRGDVVRDNTADANVSYHLMSSIYSNPLGTTWEQMATRDRFFSIHSSRRVLFKNLQARNHWATLADVNSTSNELSDLTYGRPGSTTDFTWYNRLGTMNDIFGDYRQMVDDAGNPGDIFMMGDIDGDGRKDLVIGSFISSTSVSWSFKRSTGSAFVDHYPGNPLYGPTALRGDGGDVGDIFRMADVDGDGDDDLVMGRPYSSTKISWFVYRTGISSVTGNYVFNSAVEWRDDAGSEGDLFMLGDVTNNGKADLVMVRRGSGTTAYVYESNGSDFNTSKGSKTISDKYVDMVMIGNVNNNANSPADLVFGIVKNSSSVDWYASLSNSCNSTGCFNNASLWSSVAGDAGDLFRLGDGNNDGLMDIFYGRWKGMNSLTATPNLGWISWFGRYSTGSAFDSTWYEWAYDAGAEGDMYP